jgi:acyl-CoA thioesterase-1
MDRATRRRKVAAAAALLVGLIALVASPALACRLTVLGDSLTSGYGLGEDEAFPAQLQAILDARGTRCEVINAGASGDTSAAGLARLDWVLADEPTHLLVELGGNDALRALKVEELEVNINQIVLRAQSTGVEVMLAGMLAPPNLGRAYGDAFRQVFADVAAARGVPLYPFFLDGVALDRSLMQPDGIHPNTRGVQVIAERIAPFVQRFIEDD